MSHGIQNTVAPLEKAIDHVRGGSGDSSTSPLPAAATGRQHGARPDLARSGYRRESSAASACAAASREASSEREEIPSLRNALVS